MITKVAWHGPVTKKASPEQFQGQFLASKGLPEAKKGLLEAGKGLLEGKRGLLENVFGTLQ